MQNFILPENIREALLGYLGRRPYSEVHSGVKALLELEPLGGPEPEAAPSDPEPNSE
jgi:hypothetical protein